MNREVVEGAIERVTHVIVDRLARDEPPTPAALRFLLQRYAATAREDIQHAVESALAAGLDAALECRAEDRAGWLMLLAEASAVSDDDRLPTAAVELVDRLRRDWGRPQALHEAARNLDGCLLASQLTRGGPGFPADFVRAAIDELERLVGSSYRPGEGVAAATADPGRSRTRLADQCGVASMLLTAFQQTDRLPYAMLAEELVQYARRTLWDEERGGFFEGDPTTKPFALNCEAVSVLSRLVVLRRSDEYRRAAVVVSGATYGPDAERILDWLAPAAPEHGLDAAFYGLAALHWQSAL